MSKRTSFALFALAALFVTLLSWAAPSLLVPGCDDASATVRGCVTTTTQTFAGSKTLTDTLIFQDTGDGIQNTADAVRILDDEGLTVRNAANNNAAPLSASTLTSTNSSLTGSNGVGTFTFTGNINAATASSSVAAYTFTPANALDAADQVLRVTSSADADLLTVANDGYVVITGGIEVTGSDGIVAGTGGVSTQGTFETYAVSPQFLTATATTTMGFQSLINAATASSTVGAYTFAPQAVLGANDLLIDVKNQAGATTVASIDLEGDVVFAGDLTIDNTFTGSLTTNSTQLLSARTAASTTSTSAAVEIGGNVVLGANDLVMAILAGGVGEVAGFDYEGDLIGSIQGTTTFAIRSLATDATTSTTVGAITMAASNDIGTADLVFDLQDSSGNHLMSMQERGLLQLGGAGAVVGLQSTATGVSFSFTSDTDATTASASLAAFTFTGGTLDANDLVFAVQPAATTRFSIDQEGDVRVQSLLNIVDTTFSISSIATDTTTSGTVGAITLKSTVDITATDLLLDIQNSAAGHVATLTEAGMFRSITPMTLASVFIGAVTTATTNYGGDVLPAFAFTVNQVTMRTSAAGSGGTTDFIFRVTDGTNTCDCTMACNAVAGNKALTCAGSAGSGCALPASASLTYSVQSIGDCSAGPTVVGNAQVRGYWTP